MYIYIYVYIYIIIYILKMANNVYYYNMFDCFPMLYVCVLKPTHAGHGQEVGLAEQRLNEYMTSDDGVTIGRDVHGKYSIGPA